MVTQGGKGLSETGNCALGYRGRLAYSPGSLEMQPLLWRTIEGF